MKLKFFTSLALLCMFGVGAFAQTTQTTETYKANMSSSTTDAASWKITPEGAETTGVPAGTAVTATYNGDRTVKSVKAVKSKKVDLSKLTTSTYEAKNGDELVGTTGIQVIIPADATVTLNNATISGGIVCAGSASIVIVGENSVTNGSSYPGIKAGVNGSTVTISGTGSLYAAGGSYAPGIGGCSGADCGNIVISGGTITAVGGSSAAGIGCGMYCSCGNITIESTVTSVTAIKGTSASTSIGSNGYTCGTITIGGIVTGDITEDPYSYPTLN